MQATIDLNCDLGEGAGHDAELMPLITSANIACGGHAGDKATMRATVELARRHGAEVGAHPGFEDREHFGRRELALPASEVSALVTRQVQALRRVAPVRFVKPHGALYNLAARDERIADAIAEAVREIDRALAIVALPGCALARAALARNVRVIHEAFADRTYQRDGHLTPRSRPGALIADESAAVGQVLRMVREGVVRSIDGADVPVRADTVCIHGDGPHAVAFARRLRAELVAAGVALKAPV